MIRSSGILIRTRLRLLLPGALGGEGAEEEAVEGGHEACRRPLYKSRSSRKINSQVQWSAVRVTAVTVTIGYSDSYGNPRFIYRAGRPICRKVLMIMFGKFHRLIG